MNLDTGLPIGCAGSEHGHVAGRLTGPERNRDGVGREARGIGEGDHITEGDRHPFRARGLAADHGQSGSALRREDVPGQQRLGRRRAPFRGQHLPDLIGGFRAALDRTDLAGRRTLRPFRTITLRSP